MTLSTSTAMVSFQTHLERIITVQPTHYLLEYLLQVGVGDILIELYV